MTFTTENVARYARRTYRQLYTPLPMYSLMLDKAVFGEKPLPFKVHNLLLHSIGALLLFLIFRRFKLSPALACIGTLLWAVHPQRNESVLWIVERKDVLCGVFVFGAFLAFLRGMEEPGSLIWLCVSGILSVLALGCKPSAAPLCGVYAVYALACGRRKRRLLIPVLATLAGVILVARITAADNPGALQSNFMVVLHNLFWYPLTALLPVFNCSPIYPRVGSFVEHLPLLLSGAAVFAGISIYALKVRRIPLRCFIGGVMIAGGMLLPSLGLWQYTEFHYCDRYNYVAAPAVILPVVLLCSSWRRLSHCLAVLVTVCLAATWIGGSAWHSDRALWRQCLKAPCPNPKAFQVASADALMREDADDLEYIAIRLTECREELPFRDDRAMNTAQLLQAHAAILREDFARGLPILAQLLHREEILGEEVKFMRGDNYRYILDTHAPLARIYMKRRK